MSRIGRVLINVSELRRVPLDPNDVYFLEAVGGDTLGSGYLWLLDGPDRVGLMRSPSPAASIS